MNDQERSVIQRVLDFLESGDFVYPTDLAYSLRSVLEEEPACNPHPRAPHGFVRNASHNEDQYVCECRGWDPYEAGYDAGFRAGLNYENDLLDE